MNLTSEQREAVTRLADSLCVVAGAGTGKTRVLVERYLQLLSHGGVGPEQVAAITFTEKAATEMASRLRGECDRRSRAASSADQRRLWQRRRDALAASTIDTIHGFCSRLVRQYPVEAGVDPYFDIIADSEQQQLLSDSVRATVSRLFDEGNDDILAAPAAYGLRTLMSLLEQAVSKRAAVVDAAPAMDRPTDEIVETIRQVVERELGGLIDAMLTAMVRPAGVIRAAHGGEDDLAESARQQAVEALQMAASGNPLHERLQGLRVLASVTLRGGSARKWSSKELLNRVKDALKALKTEAKAMLAECPVTDPANWPAEAVLARSLTHAALAAINDYQRAKIARGVLDYDDLLIKARNLLRDHPKVRRTLASRMQHVLVDELQDTDPLQIEILGLLLGKSGPGGFKPRAGAFFGVGDPKQSIYRFRGADVGAFRRLAGGFAPAGVVNLSETFRFHRGLGGVTNVVFAEVLGEEFSPLSARREETPPVSVEVLLAGDDRDLCAEDLRFREAARVARRIRTLIDEDNVQPGDIAILMHRQTQSFPYEDALTRLGIPFHMAGGRRFYEQEEVRDVVTALRAVRNPGDDLSLAALLRSPLFGLSDDALYLLCRRGRLSETVHSEAARGALTDGDAEKASRAVAWLAHFSDRAGRIGVAQLIDEMVFTAPPRPAAKAAWLTSFCRSSSASTVTPTCGASPTRPARPTARVPGGWRRSLRPSSAVSKRASRSQRPR